MVDIEIDAFRYKNLGHRYFSSYETTRAKLYYIRYAKLNHQSKANLASVYSNWGGCLYFERKYHKAIRKCKQALLFDPNLHYIWNGWGTSLSHLGKFDEAIEKFHQALKINPKYTIAHLNLVLALFLKKSDEEAFKYFDNLKAKTWASYEKEDLKVRNKKEVEILDLRLVETTEQSEILMIQERKQGLEKLLVLLSKLDEV